MSGPAKSVEGELRRAVRDVSLRPEDRLKAKIDYSRHAIRQRLDHVEQARRACARLLQAGTDARAQTEEP
ncbi:MAG: hypothetical protein AB8H79_08365 [Myxococcota bacterium]